MNAEKSLIYGAAITGDWEAAESMLEKTFLTKSIRYAFFSNFGYADFMHFSLVYAALLIYKKKLVRALRAAG